MNPVRKLCLYNGVKRIIATIVSAVIGALLSIPVYHYGHYKQLRQIKNPYTGYLLVFMLIGAAVGAMSAIFWFSSDETDINKKR